MRIRDFLNWDDKPLPKWVPLSLAVAAIIAAASLAYDAVRAGGLQLVDASIPLTPAVLAIVTWGQRRNHRD